MQTATARGLQARAYGRRDSGNRDHFRQGRWMNRFSNAESADMHNVYVAVDGKARASVRMFLELSLNRRQPSHVLFGQ